MRQHSRDRGRLEDMLKYAQNVEQIVSGITYEQFVADIRIYYSVMKNIEVIGEAANMLTKDFRLEHPEVPWRDIIDMRNVLVHDYIHISKDMLWATITKDISHLKVHIEKFYKDFK